jgi:hypothetical protein
MQAVTVFNPHDPAHFDIGPQLLWTFPELAAWVWGAQIETAINLNLTLADGGQPN